MAQSGKANANMKQLGAKKSPEGGGGGGKKKNKQKKPASEHTGDGTPSAKKEKTKSPESAAPVIVNDKKTTDAVQASNSVSVKKEKNKQQSAEPERKQQSVEAESKPQSAEAVEKLTARLNAVCVTETQQQQKSHATGHPAQGDKISPEVKEKALNATASANEKQEAVKGKEGASAESVGKKKENKKKDVDSSEVTKDAQSGEQKSKAQLRAERRAIQEAQREAKEAKKSEVGVSASVSSSISATKVTAATPAVEKQKPGVQASDKQKPGAQASDKQRGEDVAKKIVKKKPAVSETEEQMWARMEKEIIGKTLKIDNRVLNLGFQYFHHKIVGANARCLAMLITLREVIGGYKTPEEKDLSRDLEKSLLNPCIKYLNYCRPISISMGNAIKYLKYHINKIPSNMDDEVAISKLQGVIDEFITEKIMGASRTIAEYSKVKINDNDVILVYAGSSLIGRVLKDAHKAGKKFRVIVVEGRPRTEGKTMLRFLVRCGIPCSYIYIGSAVYAMSEVTKVFLGAAAMFATGDMYSRSGNSMIAALARANNIPVLVCCETYKFTDKVQLHTGDSNLHAQGCDLINIGHRPPILENYEELGLRLLNVVYDVTGSKYITCLITEQGFIMPATILAILRKHEDLLEETSGK